MRLNAQLLQELAKALRSAEENDKVRCIVLTGSEKAFAAGADIKDMAEKGFVDVFTSDLFGAESDRVPRVAQADHRCGVGLRAWVAAASWR
jgi:enoyl-CoA hydratase